MAYQDLVKAWVYWGDDSTAQEFMDRNRADGRLTIGAAVDAYVVEIPGLDRAWAGLNAEELEEIRDVLMSYLFLTRGTSGCSDMLGIFSAKDVLPLEFKPAHPVGDLLTQHLDELEQEAERKGGVLQTLADHFAKVYKVPLHSAA